MTPLVLDTSVLINLHASQLGNRIVDALPNEIVVPEIVASELQVETMRPDSKHQFIMNMADGRNVCLVSMTDVEYRLFGNLVSGKPSLGDGESATIAIAVCRGHLPIIDERKGRNQARVLLDGRHPGWSLCLFRHPRVVAALGPNLAVEALYLALRDGRMRIHEDHCEQVVSLIGAQRALKCNSLPGYKARRIQWQM